VPKGFVVQPFVKLGVRKLELGEFFGLIKNNKLIAHPKIKKTFVQHRCMST
jgi:hypothetical protein